MTLIALAGLIGICVVTYCAVIAQPRPEKTRAQLRRELAEAERSHAKRSHIRKLYVQATCRELSK
jgi:hypothetical protein